MVEEISSRQDEAEGERSWMQLVADWLGMENGWFDSIGQIGGWSQQMESLRLSNLNMMLMDVEEQLKTSWKRQWRKAISGDPNKRVRDHMGDPKVKKRVKLYDTASFTLGVIMVLLSEYLLLVYPSAFPYFYMVTFTLLFIIRYLTYKAIKYHYFLIDFCYLINTSSILQSVVCSGTTDQGICSVWFKVNYVQSHGPIGMAILAWQNSMVFHSVDKMTSFYIHIMPLTLNYLVRWNLIPDSTSEELSLSFVTAILMPSIIYCIWQAGYLYIQKAVIDKDPELVTSMRYLTQCPRNPLYIIVRDICVSLGIFNEEEVYQADDMKTKIIYVVGQFSYMFTCLLPIPLLFYFRSLNTAYILFLMAAATWRGGSYYVFHFTKTYNKKFDEKSESKEQ